MPPYKILFQDDQLLVIEKAPNLVVTPSNTQQTDTLADLLQREQNIDLDRGGIVHRLDKDTSGLMLIAKTQDSLEGLQAQFKTRTIKKEYTTLVHGHTPDEGEINGPIGRNPRDREKFIVFDQGKEAVTLYKLTDHLIMPEEKLNQIFEGFTKIQFRKLRSQNYNQFSLLTCFPQTGRTHQIRVHMKYIGHSIVGDEKYGGRKTSRLDKRWCKRQFLHASKLIFTHPKTGEILTFESPLPQDLQQALQNLIVS